MMKRIGIAIVLTLVLAVVAFAAESITCSTAGGSSDTMLIKCVCVSAADGSFTPSTKVSLTNSAQYWNKDFALVDATAVNRSSGQPDTAGTVTITDEFGQQLVGTTAGDTLTLSTSASGFASLSVDRASSQRIVFAPLYLTIGDTQSGSATSTFDLYLKLRK